MAGSARDEGPERAAGAPGDRAPSPAPFDPADPAPAARRAARLWLAAWRALAFRPQQVPALAERAREPGNWLEAAGTPPLPEAEADRALDGLARAGVRLLPYGAADYPRALARLDDPPLVLALRGDPAHLARPAVAIVGSRAATVYGTSVAERLAGDLASAGLVVISGLARGVDAAAHRGALAAGGLSIALQACGPERVYPAAHRRLARALVERGAVATELPPGTPPRPPYFPLRNRLISGLASAVVVVEGRRRSGSLVTARHAGAQGKEVLAVPGPVDAPTSEGPNALLVDGAGVARGAADVLEAIGISSGAPPSAGAERAEAAPASAEARAILEALARARLTRDELARALGRGPEALATALVTLEIEGRVAEDRDGRLRLVAWAPRARL